MNVQYHVLVTWYTIEVRARPNCTTSRIRVGSQPANQLVCSWSTTRQQRCRVGEPVGDECRRVTDCQCLRLPRSRKPLPGTLTALYITVHHIWERCTLRVCDHRTIPPRAAYPCTHGREAVSLHRASLRVSGSREVPPYHTHDDTYGGEAICLHSMRVSGIP
jgi:hypothetical protein